MNPMETMIYLLTEYNKGNYTTSDFCDLFEEHYRDVELLPLSKKAEDWLEGLDELCGRFSEYPEDHRIYPGIYYTDEDIRTHMKDFSPDMLDSNI